MNDLMNLEFENQTVRTIERGGEVWRVAKDVCEVLKINNASQATSYLDEDERCVITNDTRLNNWETITVSESGLYSLILRSRKPEARRYFIECERR